MKTAANTQTKTGLVRNTSYVAEPIETKVRRMLSNKEPITDGAPLIYTDRKDGVLPEYDIRTDKMELAVEAMSTIDKANKAKREDRHKPKETKVEPGATEPNTVNKVEPTQATKKD